MCVYNAYPTHVFSNNASVLHMPTHFWGPALVYLIYLGSDLVFIQGFPLTNLTPLYETPPTFCLFAITQQVVTAPFRTTGNLDRISSIRAHVVAYHGTMAPWYHENTCPFSMMFVY